MTPTKIFTLGYSGWKPEAITELAQRMNALVVDCRLVPQSRYAPWNGVAFARRMGMHYLYVRAFGNVNYKLPLEHAKLANFEQGALQVERCVANTGRPIILMCGCKDVQECHRRLVAKSLANRWGATITHIPTPPKKPSQGPSQGPSRPKGNPTPSLFPDED